MGVDVGSAVSGATGLGVNGMLKPFTAEANRNSSNVEILFSIIAVAGFLLVSLVDELIRLNVVSRVDKLVSLCFGAGNVDRDPLRKRRIVAGMAAGSMPSSISLFVESVIRPNERRSTNQARRFIGLVAVERSCT